MNKTNQNTGNKTHRYAQSEAYLARAEKTIPLGSQTFSKSKTQYPFGVSPYAIKRAQGSRVWDLDGNEYIDFINSLCSITLGYRDPDVEKAVRAQQEDGIIFSLPHPIEADVAEKIVEMVPCAEKVRFGKNGSDATSGAIRVARAFTGRDHVAACGYHGWQDWYIGATPRNLGVPKAVQDLTHLFKYNDIESLHALFKAYPNQIAAVILEPMGAHPPKDQFLEKVKELAHKNGAVLIFDETVTGFRVSNGGAQELYGVKPDLGTFGKGLANGYPVSAVAGRADIMKLMEEVFFSFTFGGEALSLAAAHATLTKLQREPVIKTMSERGTELVSGIKEKITKHGLDSVFSISGHPAWSFLAVSNTPHATLWEIKTLFSQEVFARGFLTLGTHNISYAHSAQDISKMVGCYDEVLKIIAQAIETRSVVQSLRTQPLVPLFKLR